MHSILTVAWRTGALLALAGTSPLAAAQAKAADLPSADQILARYQAFLGGGALSAVRTRTTTTRRFERSETPSEEVLLRYSKRPMLSIMHHEALDGSFIRYMNGCDAVGGWVGYGRTNDGAPKPGEASTDGVCQQEQYYYGYLPLDLDRLHANVSRFEVRARTRIVTADPGAEGALAGGRGRDLVPAGARDAYLVLSVPAHPTDQYVWLYFDAGTGALLRRADAGRGPVPVQPGTNPRYTDFLQYRDVGDGTRAPFQFVTTAPNSIVRGVETAIADNQPVADEMLARPKDVSRADKGL